MKNLFVITSAMVIVALAAALTFVSCRTSAPSAVDSLPLDPVQREEPAQMTSAPLVPPAITRGHAARVILDVEVKEHTKTLADGVSYTYWTFGDDAPGKFIRVREGDLIETRLHNHPDNSLAHNIDFHAATGPGGGGEASFVAPGHSATFTWRALRPGLYLYHCVAAPAGLHIANGMYGLILVEPKAGLPKVDREYFIVQGEFYTEGKYGAPGQQRFSMDKAVKEQPEYVVFNGRVGALMNEGALKTKVGERVRIYLGNAGPSLVSSFHVVGEIFDSVYGEGGVLANQHNVQTTIVPVGGSAMVEFAVEVPGEYALVDHSMFRAFNKGAMGLLKAEGRENVLIFSGKTSEEPYQPGTRLARPELPSAGASDSPLEQGARVYSTICAACHQAQGQGVASTFPPLAGSDYLMADKDRSIRILLEGLKGEITVNGSTYRGEMPKLPLSDEQIASVLSYVRSAFGNQGSPVTVDDVSRVRASGAAEPAVASQARLSPASVSADDRK